MLNKAWIYTVKKRTKGFPINDIAILNVKLVNKNNEH